MEALGALSQRLAEAIYKASADEAGMVTPRTDGADGVDDAEIVDAEVVDEGDDQAERADRRASERTASDDRAIP
jgi:hypothetical protein